MAQRSGRHDRWWRGAREDEDLIEVKTIFT